MNPHEQGRWACQHASDTGSVPGDAKEPDQSVGDIRALVVLMGWAEFPLNPSWKPSPCPHKEPWTKLKIICCGIRVGPEDSWSSTE